MSAARIAALEKKLAEHEEAIVKLGELFRNRQDECDLDNLREFERLKGVLIGRLAIGVAGMNDETVEKARARIATAVAR